MIIAKFNFNPLTKAKLKQNLTSLKSLGFHGDLVVFFFGRGRNLPQEVVSSLNMSTSDLSMISAPNTTLTNLNATLPVANA